MFLEGRHMIEGGSDIQHSINRQGTRNCLQCQLNPLNRTFQRLQYMGSCLTCHQDSKILQDTNFREDLKIPQCTNVLRLQCKAICPVPLHYNKTLQDTVFQKFEPTLHCSIYQARRDRAACPLIHQRKKNLQGNECHFRL
jgi:hypothetical protein